MDLGILAINTLNELSILGNAATRIIRPTDGLHWYATDHVFGEVTAFGMSAARSDQDYSYKTVSEILEGNQDFGRIMFSMSPPPLGYNPIGTNITNVTTLPIGINSYWCKNARTNATDTNSTIVKAKRKIARTRGPRVRPIIVRIIIDKI